MLADLGPEPAAARHRFSEPLRSSKSCPYQVVEGARLEIDACRAC